MAIVIASDQVPLEKDSHGVVRVGGFRVTLETIVTAYQLGAMPETLAAQYPAVSLADIYAVIGYYLRHRAEVDAYLDEQREKGYAIRRDYQSRFPQQGIRDRLLAHRGPTQES